ncbi:MAG TPA: MarR family transcriptional regulator [Solirubrobacteraceae bacterium]|nr:MarR family transcriptional regulator [Solirubrobacteraceae bacterium]
MEADAQLTPADLAGELRELDVDTLPTELRVVLGRLLRRLRSEHRFPLTQASVLGLLDRDGSRSIGELAAIESVRPQSMSQTVCELEAEGLIVRHADASDGRRSQIALTASGRAALDADRAAREGWLSKEIAEFTPDEQQTLRDAVALLARLANAG